MTDTLDETIDTLDCIPGKTAISCVADGKACAIPSSSGVMIHCKEPIPWYQIKNMIDALNSLYREYPEEE